MNTDNPPTHVDDDQPDDSHMLAVVRDLWGIDWPVDEHEPAPETSPDRTTDAALE